MTEDPTRILSAVMFADMVGFTALMGRDEDAAREKRDRQREMVGRLAEEFGGRVMQYYGDGTAVKRSDYYPSIATPWMGQSAFCNFVDHGHARARVRAPEGSSTVADTLRPRGDSGVGPLNVAEGARG